MSVAPNFAIVTLGVRDLQRSIAFYTALGWERRGNPSDGIVWFRTSGSWIGLFGYDALAEDAALAAPGSLPAYRGITLALNLPSESAVDDAFDVFTEAGASVVKPAERVFWGGYSGYVADPDGHLWELAHNPNFPIDAEGRIDIP
jgi:uncharacterized protein